MALVLFDDSYFGRFVQFPGTTATNLLLDDGEGMYKALSFEIADNGINGIGYIGGIAHLYHVIGSF